MAEVGETQNAQPEAAQESKPVVDQAALTPSAPRESLFKKVLNLLSLKPKAPGEPQGTQSTDQELRDQAAAIHAEKLNVKAAMQHPESPLAGKIDDPQKKLDALNQNISEISAKLPPRDSSVGEPTSEQQSDQTTPSVSDEKAA